MKKDTSCLERKCAGLKTEVVTRRVKVTIAHCALNKENTYWSIKFMVKIEWKGLNSGRRTTRQTYDIARYGVQFDRVASHRGLKAVVLCHY